MIRAALALALAAGPALAHEGEVHVTPEAAARPAAERAAAPVTPLPFDLGGPFALVDQGGAPRTEADPEGRMQLLFFGYANCPAICTAALPMMADAADALSAAGVPAVPVMITVDPERDTVESIGAPLAAIHPEFVGLTGTPEALAAARAVFGVERELAMEHPELGPIYAHGSHVFLLSPAGEVLTLLPPILGAARAAEIAARYAVAADRAAGPADDPAPASP